jgi:hypothetical protein
MLGSGDLDIQGYDQDQRYHNNYNLLRHDGNPGGKYNKNDEAVKEGK